MRIEIDEVRLHFVEIPLKTPFQTSFGTETAKSCWLVEVVAEGLSGWGETVASVEPLYSEETHASVYYAIKNHLLPRLAGVDVGQPGDAARAMADVRGNRMAKAGLELAIWDWAARAANRPLAHMLGGDADKREIPVGVSIGIQPSPGELVRVAASYLEEGYRRLKIKIKPGQDRRYLEAVRDAFGPSAAVMADANSAYRLADTEALRALDDLDLMMLEQPLAEDDYVDHRHLRGAIRTPICLDESIRSADDARRAIELGAVDIINIKVGRLGGHTEARAVHDRARAAGLPVWCGGMLETGIGRAHNLHVSTLPGFVLPGDTSASDRYFADDVIDPPFHLNANGTLTVPAGPGIGVVPDPRRLARYRQYGEVLDMANIGKGGRPHAGGTAF